jgi:hypothetical protein
MSVHSINTRNKFHLHTPSANPSFFEIGTVCAAITLAHGPTGLRVKRHNFG